jgi:hypothetical protein
MLTAHKVNLPQKRIYVVITKRLLIRHLAVGAKAANFFTERDVDTKPQLLTIRKRKLPVVFILEEKRFR